MRADPRPQQLVCTQPQHIEDHPVDLLDRPFRHVGDDLVEQPHRTAGAVGQFGGQGSVAAGDLAVPQHLRQYQVGVGVALTHSGQHLHGSLPGRIYRGVFLIVNGAVHVSACPSVSLAPRAQSGPAIAFLPCG